MREIVIIIIRLFRRVLLSTYMPASLIM